MDSVRTGNARDHACSDQHQHAMLLYCKELGSTAKIGEPSSSNFCTVDNNRRNQFDMAANHKLAFSKYTAICNLESWSS